MLKKILPILDDSRGKWTLHYDGTYVMKKAFSGGALNLTTMDGEEFPFLVNLEAVKKPFYLKKEENKARKVENPKGRLRKKRCPGGKNNNITVQAKIRDKIKIRTC